MGRAYNDRVPQSALEGQEYAEDQIPDRDSVNERGSTGKGKANGERLWSADEREILWREWRESLESGSGSTGGSGGKRWKFPPNFNDANAGFGDANAGAVEKKKKKKKKGSLGEDR